MTYSGPKLPSHHIVPYATTPVQSKTTLNDVGNIKKEKNVACVNKEWWVLKVVQQEWAGKSGSSYFVITCFWFLKTQEVACIAWFYSWTIVCAPLARKKFLEIVVIKQEKKVRRWMSFLYIWGVVCSCWLELADYVVSTLGHSLGCWFRTNTPIECAPDQEPPWKQWLWSLRQTHVQVVSKRYQNPVTVTGSYNCRDRLIPRT